MLPLLLFLLILGQSGFAQRRTLISLRSNDEQWLSLKEIVKGQEYWLRPRSVLESARRCETCGFNKFVLSVRFWDQKLLETAESSLRRQGFCQKEDACRVTPYQAERMRLRDALQSWRTLTPWVPVDGMVPETQDFLIGPTKEAVNVANFSLTSGSVSSFYITVVSSDLSAPAGKEQLIFTGEDLLWAHRLLKTPGSKKNELIDGGSLRKLAVWLLKMKARDMNGALPLFPGLMARIERQLVVTAVKYRRGLEKLLPKGYRAKEGELFYVLKKVEPNEQIIVTLMPNMRLSSITLLLKIAKNFEFTDAQEKPLVDTRDDSLLPTLLPQKKLTNVSLPTRVEILEDRLTTLMRILNISNSIKDYPDIPLLRQQVSQLAKLMNATHIIDRENINLTAIDDCFDVKQKGMDGKVYFLRSIQKPVLCTKDGDLVVLQRSGGKVSFNESWVRYEEGLGDVRGDFFIGLKDLSVLTQSSDMCMILILTPWRLMTSPKRGDYDSFLVGPASDKYRLSYAGYKGSFVFDVLSIMNNQRFSTFDEDNDAFVGSCAKRFHSGNWFQSCTKANIFGPYRNAPNSGMCSVGLLSSQGDMCSPLDSVQMLLRRKANSGGSQQIIFSAIAPYSKCKAKLQLFNVTATGMYTVTVGGAQGGRYNHGNSRLGGRGAKVKANFYLKKGTTLAVSAGCRGLQGSYAGYGGDASWLVSRTHGILLAVAGGGGGASDHRYQPYLQGLPGRASTDGGDGWWFHYRASGDANSTLLVKNFGTRAKGWPDLRDRLLTATSGDFSSGGKTNCVSGNGGGGFQGGVGCGTGNRDGGGGGGSFCNSTAADSCDLSTGGNTRPYGYVIIQRNFCF